MRIRSIKPQFFRDSKILDLPPLGRLLFIGLWCCADRDGRMVFDPRELRREVLPDESQETVNGLFAVLESSKLTVRYEVEGKQYLAIPNFLKHQTPYHKEQASECPGLDQGMTLTSSGHNRSGAGAGAGALEVLSSNSPAANVDTPVAPARVKRTKTNGHDPELVRYFDAFYADYPRHQGKQAAFKAFIKLKPDRDVLRVISRDIHAKIEAGDWDPGDSERVRFIPLPATYLNGRRWEDESYG